MGSVRASIGPLKTGLGLTTVLLRASLAELPGIAQVLAGPPGSHGPGSTTAFTLRRLMAALVGMTPKLAQTGGFGTSGGGGVGGGGTPPVKNATYSYSCEPLAGGVKFTLVKGSDFPTAPGTTVTVTPEFDGIFTAFGVSHPCGQDAASKGPFGPFPVDGTGKFDAGTVTVLYGCQPTCSVRLVVSCNKLLPARITDPRGPFCKCL